MFALVLAAALLPPVTQEEAVDFHLKGKCEMAQPGQGITRADGRGWIATMLPGAHRVWAVGGAVAIKGAPMGVLNIEPGRAAEITVRPSTALVMWKPLEARVSGRASEGPVPPAFLYDAKLASDQ